jgi:hypothetical protein
VDVERRAVVRIGDPVNGVTVEVITTTTGQERP